MADILKAEAENLVRVVVHDWASETGFDRLSGAFPGFRAFREWLLSRWPHALSFTSTMGADYDAEMWFDDELGQNSRN